MAQAMDAHSSFIYLIDHLPAWKACIDSLIVHAAQKNAEYAAEYTRLVKQIRPKRRKSPSVASIHDHDDEPMGDRSESSSNPGGVSSPDPAEINPLEAGCKYLYAQARRRRKPGNSIRSGASGPQKFRNKNHVIVYYDGYLQEQLDSMVKMVGVARNNLRKGKAALAAARGFRLSTLTTRVSHGHPTLEDIRSTIASRNTSALLSGRKYHTSAGQPAPDEETAFLQVDKQLESIQSLCETAAHQFLRDGDCKSELDNVQQKFDAVLAQAIQFAESLKKSQETQDSSNVEMDHPNSDSSHGSTDSDGTLSTQPSLDVLRTPKMGATSDPSPLIINHPLESMKSRPAFMTAPGISADNNNPALVADNIEVDDASDQDSIVVDISQYRITNPRRVRV